MDAAVLIKAIEAAFLDVPQGLLQRFLRRRGRFLPGNAARAAGRLRLGGYSQQVHDIKAATWGERKNSRGDFVRAVSSHFRTAFDAESLAAAGEEEAQIVVNLRGSSDRRARVASGIFLANGDGGSDAGDFVDVGLFHAFEELPSISRERFHIAALPFGVNRVKGQGRFAGAADASDDSDGVVRDVDGDVPKIVNTGAADAYGLLFAKHGCEFFSGQRVAQTARLERTA